MGERLLFGLSWLQGSVSALLSYRKDFKISSIFAVCLDTAMSRQDNFFLLVRACSSLDEIYALMLTLNEPWNFLLFLQYYVVFLFFECCLSSGGIFLSFYSYL